jgi:tRNA pseudouridine38-40 synthase
VRIALGIEYDGSDFHGWQTQDGVPSVQEALEQALSNVADHPVRVVVAGRTDTGVHALSQVAHFDTDARRDMRGWVFGANSQLPRGVAVLWAQPVDEAFHARFSARARRYRYVILNRPSRPGLLPCICWANMTSAPTGRWGARPRARCARSTASR